MWTKQSSRYFLYQESWKQRQMLLLVLFESNPQRIQIRAWGNLSAKALRMEMACISLCSSWGRFSELYNFTLLLTCRLCCHPLMSNLTQQLTCCQDNRDSWASLTLISNATFWLKKWRERESELCTSDLLHLVRLCYFTAFPIFSQFHLDVFQRHAIRMEYQKVTQQNFNSPF